MTNLFLWGFFGEEVVAYLERGIFILNRQIYKCVPFFEDYCLKYYYLCIFATLNK